MPPIPLLPRDNKKNESLVSHHKMQMQTQQRTLLNNRETMNKKSVFSTYSFILTNRWSYHVGLLGKEFHAVGDEKPKLWLPNVFVRTHRINIWSDFENRREAREGNTETCLMYEERYLGAKECRQRKVVV